MKEDITLVITHGQIDGIMDGVGGIIRGMACRSSYHGFRRGLRRLGCRYDGLPCFIP